MPNIQADLFSPQDIEALVQRYETRVSALHIPTVERELHEAVFLGPLRTYAREAHVNGDGKRSPSAEAEDHGDGHADAPNNDEEDAVLQRTACVGALLLLLESLDEHNALTQDVMTHIDNRDAAVERLMACNARYERAVGDGGGRSSSSRGRAVTSGKATASRGKGKRPMKNTASTAYANAPLAGSNGTTTGGAGNLDEAQQEFLLLLQEVQLHTLLVVEAIFRWREQLSRPYGFRYLPSSGGGSPPASSQTEGHTAQDGDGNTAGPEAASPARDSGAASGQNDENYLLHILQNCRDISSCALGQSLNLHLDKFPCSSNVDLMRVLHRKQLMQRARLINTGALLRGGVGSGSAFLRSGSAATSSSTAATSTSAALAPSRASSRHSSQRERRGTAGASVRVGGWKGSRPPTGSGTVAAGSPAHWARGTRGAGRTATPASVDPHKPLPSTEADATKRRSPLRGRLTRRKVPHASAVAVGPAERQASGASAPAPPSASATMLEIRRQKQSRLLAAEKVILGEEEVQLAVVEELYRLATEQDRFVPILPLIGVVCTDGGVCGGASEEAAPTHRGACKDSLPLRKRYWPTALRLDTDLCRLAAEQHLSKRRQQVAGDVVRGRKHLPKHSHRKPTSRTNGPPEASGGSPTRLSVLEMRRRQQRATTDVGENGDGGSTQPPPSTAEGCSSVVQGGPALLPASSAPSSVRSHSTRDDGDRAEADDHPAELTSASQSPPSSASSDSTSSEKLSPSSHKISAEESLEILRQQLLAERRAGSLGPDTSLLSGSVPPQSAEDAPAQEHARSGAATSSPESERNAEGDAEEELAYSQESFESSSSSTASSSSATPTTHSSN